MGVGVLIVGKNVYHGVHSAERFLRRAYCSSAWPSTDRHSTATCAGIFEFLNQTLLPPMRHSLPGERPAELSASMSGCMQHICIAQAQTVAAYRAELKGSSPGTLAALHSGASDELELAAKTLKLGTGSCLALRYRQLHHQLMLQIAAGWIDVV